MQLQNNLADARNNYQREINLLKQKMASLTQLSQEEIQQAFQLTMSKLQGILHCAKTNNAIKNQSPQRTQSNRTSNVNMSRSMNRDMTRNVNNNSNRNSNNTSINSNRNRNGNNTTTSINGSGDSGAVASSSKIIGELIKSLETEKAKRKSLETQVTKWSEIAFDNEKKVYHLTQQQDRIGINQSASADLTTIRMAKPLSRSHSITPRNTQNDSKKSKPNSQKISSSVTPTPNENRRQLPPQSSRQAKNNILQKVIQRYQPNN